MPMAPKVRQSHHPHQVPHMKRGACGVKTAIERHLLVSERAIDLIVCDLIDQTAPLQLAHDAALERLVCGLVLAHFPCLLLARIDDATWSSLGLESRRPSPRRRDSLMPHKRGTGQDSSLPLLASPTGSAHHEISPRLHPRALPSSRLQEREHVSSCKDAGGRDKRCHRRHEDRRRCVLCRRSALRHWNGQCTQRMRRRSPDEAQETPSRPTASTRFPVLAQALRQGKTKERRHAAFVLNTYISTMVEEAHREGSSLPSKEAAIALIEGSKRVPLTDLVPRDTIGPIVEIATLAGAHEEARDMISRFDPTRREANAIVRAAGVSRLLSYGREPHLAFVVGEAASPHPAVSRAAVDALAGLDAWTDEEKAVLCPLATTLARDEERSRAMDELPSTMLARCDGEHQGTAHDHGRGEETSR